MTAANGPSAGASRRAWAILVSALLLGLLLDLGTKAWAFRTVTGRPVVLDRAAMLADRTHDPIPPHLPVAALPGGLLDLVLVLNPGAVFGIGAEHRWFFVLFTLAAVAGGLLLFTHRLRATDRVAPLALGLVLAGGLGNLHDRLRYGRVRDFLHGLPGRRLPRGWTWPGTTNPELFPWVFNVADLLLLAGMIMLLVHFNRRRRSLPHGHSAAATRASAVSSGTSVSGAIASPSDATSQASSIEKGPTASRRIDRQ